MGITEALLASRRGFMVGAGALLFAQPKLILSKVPTLWGDGEHDDGAALRALLSGQPVKTANGDTFRALFEDGWAALKGGKYLTSEPVSPRVPFYITQAEFIVDYDQSKPWLNFGGSPDFSHKDGGPSAITHCTVRWATPPAPSPSGYVRARREVMCWNETRFRHQGPSA